VLDDVCDAPMLHLLKAPYMYWDEDCDPKEFANKVLQRMVSIKTTNLTAQREVVNQSELYVGRQLILNRITDRQYASLADNDEIDASLLEELKYKSPKMLREVALKRLAPTRMPRLDIDLQKKLNRLNVDILVHSVIPNMPILAIEVDGPHHLENYQIDNDLIKERILKMFGVPLLRVLPTERTKFFPNNLRMEEDARLFVSMFVFISSQIAQYSKHTQKSYIEWMKLDNALEQFQDNFANSYFDKPYDLLNDQQRQRVIDDVIFSKPFEDMQEFEREDMLLQEHVNLGDPEMLVSLSKHCSQPLISKDASEVWTFKAIFKHDGVIEVIPSPRIKLFADFLSDELVENIIKFSFYEFVQNWIKNRFRS
jgi:very-short-patch-repair endonuclease